MKFRRRRPKHILASQRAPRWPLWLVPSLYLASASIAFAAPTETDVVTSTAAPQKDAETADSAGGGLSSGAVNAAANSGESAPNTAAQSAAEPLPQGLNAPTPLRVVAPIYPQRAYDDEIEADVILDVELDARGDVKAVEATALTLFWYDDEGALTEEPANLDEDEWGFVEAAVRSLRETRWNPALIVDDESPEGRPQPVIVERRISYVWEDAVLEEDILSGESSVILGAPTIDPTLDPSQAGVIGGHATEAGPAYELGEDPTLPVNFEGRVLERGNRRPLAGIKISLFREPDGPRADVLTNTEGRFALRGMPEGSWYVLIDEDGFKSLEATESVRTDDALVVTYRIEREYFDAYRSETVEEPPAREVTRRTLETTEIQRIPGTNNDAIRVVQNLPGVARAPFSGGDIIVRGSEPSDSGVYIDGMPIPGLYHFGGLRSVIPTEIVQQLDFYPGNFGVRYGRATAGVLEVETTMRQADQWGGHIDINVFDTGIFLEGPIGDKLTLQIGARRSYIDAVLMAAKNVLPINLAVAPRYYDYQARLVWDINSSNKASLMVFGSDDLVDIILEDEEDLDPGIRGGFRGSQNFHSVLLRVDSQLSDKVTNTFRAIGGVQKIGLSAGDDFFLSVRLNQLALRDELMIQAKENLSFRVGLDAELTPARVSLRLPRPPTEGQQSVSFDAEEVFNISQKFLAFSPGLYAEADYRPIEQLQIIPGVRADYFGIVGRWSAEARLGLRYEVSDSVVLKGAIGNYHRAPNPQEILRDFGNPDLGLEQAVQYSLGTEWKITDYLQFDVEVFYKDMNELVSPSSQLIDREGVATPEIYNNGGVGRAYGAEFFLRHKLANNFFGWLTYTISRSERRDFGSADWRRFDTDQTHILTLLGSYNLPKNWSIGGRFRLVSGNLYTPVIGATYDVSTGSYIRVTGPVNSERQPFFHQLDVRVDKRWVFRDWTLNLYLDIQNIYNRQNPEGTAYSYDFSQSGRVSGLPFIPAFGIRGEF